MDYVEVPLFGKYSHLKCKLDKDWYQMICVDGGLNLSYKKDSGYIFISVSYNGIQKQEYVHQVIMDTRGYPKNNFLVVDHINGDRLDIRRCNLRTVSQKVNMNNINNKLNKNSKSGLRSLSKRIVNNREYWRVQFKESKKNIYDKETKNYEEAKLLAEFHNSIRHL